MIEALATGKHHGCKVTMCKACGVRLPSFLRSRGSTATVPITTFCICMRLLVSGDISSRPHRKCLFTRANWKVYDFNKQLEASTVEMYSTQVSASWTRNIKLCRDGKLVFGLILPIEWLRILISRDGTQAGAEHVSGPERRPESRAHLNCQDHAPSGSSSSVSDTVSPYGDCQCTLHWLVRIHTLADLVPRPQCCIFCPDTLLK
ncbi:hypothetical protein BJV78DRAFT_771732 [Lactifluus subvellereus]|nr:hypothetical protein BJV78DRAFT_771732 [Lactifluus subvellereus]